MRQTRVKQIMIVIAMSFFLAIPAKAIRVLPLTAFEQNYASALEILTQALEYKKYGFDKEAEQELQAYQKKLIETRDCLSSKEVRTKKYLNGLLALEPFTEMEIVFTLSQLAAAFEHKRVQESFADHHYADTWSNLAEYDFLINMAESCRPNQQYRYTQLLSNSYTWSLILHQQLRLGIDTRLIKAFKDVIALIRQYAGLVEEMQNETAYIIDCLEKQIEIEMTRRKPGGAQISGTQVCPFITSDQQSIMDLKNFLTFTRQAHQELRTYHEDAENTISLYSEDLSCLKAGMSQAEKIEMEIILALDRRYFTGKINIFKKGLTVFKQKSGRL